jgi:hypothetical protein
VLSELTLAKESDVTTAEEAKKYHSIYLSAVGFLMYLATQTHPDISPTVGVLAKWSSICSITSKAHLIMRGS